MCHANVIKLHTSLFNIFMQNINLYYPSAGFPCVMTVLLSQVSEKAQLSLISVLSLKNGLWRSVLSFSIRSDSHKKELSSVVLSHSTLQILLGLLDRPSSGLFTCSGCESSYWDISCPTELLCSLVSDSFFLSVLVDLTPVCLLSCEWSLHSPLMCLYTVLMPWLLCLCCSLSEWLSSVLVWSWLWVILFSSACFFASSEHRLGLGLCLCGCEQWICSGGTSILSCSWKKFFWMWFSQKALRSWSNSERRGRPMSRCISRFPSHSSSFENEGLKESNTKSCNEKMIYCSTELTKYLVGYLA